MMELTLIYPPLADIVYDTRSVVIGFLHLTFLGFISIFIFAQFGLVKIFDFSKKGLLFGISLFIIGFFFNEITLFASGLRSEERRVGKECSSGFARDVLRKRVDWTRLY